MKNSDLYYRKFMESVGIDLESPHAKGTPARISRFFKEYTRGLRPPDFDFTSFPLNPKHDYDQLVIVSKIPLASLCAHHHVPFIGICHVGYLPSKRIIGLSKIVRAVDWIAHKPSIQEDLTEEIADLLIEKLNPRAVCVLVKATHYCVEMRGIAKQGVQTITHCIRGKLGGTVKHEFLSLVGTL